MDAVSENVESIKLKGQISRPIRARLSMSDIDLAASRSATYDDMKSRLGVLGLKIEAFADYLGVSRTTVPKWRSVGTPPYALNVLDMLEKYTVPAAWKTSKARSSATLKDAVEAIRPAAVAVVDDAISKGWSRAQIGHALRQLAEETDPRGA